MKTTKPLFESCTAYIQIRCNGDATFTAKQLADLLEMYKLPLNINILNHEELSVTYFFVLPPPVKTQREVVEHLIKSVSNRPGVVITITF